jgi:hypothetical protein
VTSARKLKPPAVFILNLSRERRCTRPFPANSPPRPPLGENRERTPFASTAEKYFYITTSRRPANHGHDYFFTKSKAKQKEKSSPTLSSPKAGRVWKLLRTHTHTTHKHARALVLRRRLHHGHRGHRGHDRLHSRDSRVNRSGEERDVGTVHCHVQRSQVGHGHVHGVAVQVEFERKNFETRISLDRKPLETMRFQAHGST